MSLSFHLTPDHFKDVTKVDQSFYNVLNHFMYPRLDLPVFFHSVSEMIGMGKFYQVIIRGCLVVFRVNSIYGRYSCIVYFSPISWDNDIQREREVFGALLAAGFSVRVSKVEVERLGLRVKAVNGTLDRFGGEFIYKTKDTLEMRGSKYKKQRWLLHRFEREGGEVKREVTPDVFSLISTWSAGKKIRYTNFVNLINKPRDSFFFLSLYLEGALQAFSFVERVGPFYNGVVGVSNYEAPFDMLPIVQYFEAAGFPEKDTYLNNGAGNGSEGLLIQKRRLNPYVEEPMYRIPAIGPISNSYSLVKDFLK